MGLPAVAGESLQIGLVHHFPYPHSSTMVGAFINLFLPVVEKNKTIQNTDICSGVITHTNYFCEADCSLLYFKTFKPSNSYYWY